jgi:anti-anti-sigma regulatory factor
MAAEGRTGSAGIGLGGILVIDLAVVRALLEADEALRSQGRRLALLFGTACPVKRLLRLTGTQTMFACAEDRAEAIALAANTNSARSST